MTHRPIDDVSDAMTFYAALGLDVRYFAALWHTFNVGHILATDLDTRKFVICKEFMLKTATCIAPCNSWPAMSMS